MKLRMSSMFSRRARWVWSGVLLVVVAFYGASVGWYAAGTYARGDASEVHSGTIWIGLGSVGWDRRLFKSRMSIDALSDSESIDEWSVERGRYAPLEPPPMTDSWGPWSPKMAMNPDEEVRWAYGIGDLSYESRSDAMMRRVFVRVVVPLWPLMIIAASPAAISWRRHFRETRKGSCKCGYSRIGLPPDGLCPECGASATRAGPSSVSGCSSSAHGMGG